MAAKKKRARGRPVIEPHNRMTASFIVKCTAAQKRGFHDYARSIDQQAGVWARELLLKASEQK